MNFTEKNSQKTIFPLHLYLICTLSSVIVYAKAILSLVNMVALFLPTVPWGKIA